MGLWQILTTPLGVSTRFHWREPPAFRIRLRGDVWLRLAVVLGSWALGVGVFALLFANNVRRPGLALAIGLGALFGLVAGLLVFLLRDHVSGRVQIDDDEIRRHRTYAGLAPGTWSEWQYWPWDAIESCTVVPASALGKSFSLLVLKRGDSRETIGVPASVELTKLQKFLTSRGVAVGLGKAAPAPCMRPLSVAVAATVPAIGMIALGIGLLWFASARGAFAGKGPAGGAAIDDVARFDEDRDGPDRNIAIDAGGSAPAAPGAPPSAMPDNAPGGRRFGPGSVNPGVFAPPGFGAPPAGDASLPADSAPANVKKTDVVGAPGGFDFQRAHPQGKPVLGFRSHFGSWAGKQWIGRLEPLYGGEPVVQGFDTVVAKPGYAVGGLRVDSPEFVNAYAVVFHRLRADGTLDPDDHYDSDWIGPKSDQPEKTLRSEGRAVIGIHGRAGAILNAVGLFVADP